jgi:hypothetical protein
MLAGGTTGTGAPAFLAERVVVNDAGGAGPGRRVPAAEGELRGVVENAAEGGTEGVAEGDAGAARPVWRVPVAATAA